jgi:acetolactate synthase-1/2/3 large subunit
MSETTIGYNEKLFNSCKKIVINIDDEILRINKINVDLFIQRDIHNFINYLPSIDYKIEENWRNLCKIWKTKFFFEKPTINYNKDCVNPYDFFEKFSNMIPDESIIIPAAGSIFYILRHMIKIKEKTKVVTFSQQDLGYELPAAIGAYFGAYVGTNKPIYCFNGDGSIQFNIQELQTIVHYNIPVKIIIFNNHKYGCIEVTQKSYFGNTFGINKETGLSFPNFKKLAYAYDIDYLYINSIEQIKDIFNEIYNNKPVIIEIEAEYQDRHPKLGMYTDLNGNKVPTPFDKMNPQIE